MECPVHRRLFLIRRSSIYGSPVRSSMSLCPYRLSYDRTQMSHHEGIAFIFTCRLYTVQASAPLRVDNTIAKITSQESYVSPFCIPFIEGKSRLCEAGYVIFNDNVPKQLLSINDNSSKIHMHTLTLFVCLKGNTNKALYKFLLLHKHEVYYYM